MTETDLPRPRTIVASALAFGWVFACGCAWIHSGARNDVDRWPTSVFWGSVAALPGLAVAIAIFVQGALRLLKGKPASMSALTFAAGTMFGGFLMDHMVLGILLDHLFPTYYAHGRRLHRGTKLLAPPVRAGEGWLDASVVDVAVPEAERAGVAAAWRENAGKEHASIAAFAQLTLDLLVVGAPARLVAAAQRDAADEVRHAELCYAIAAKIDGVAAAAGPFPEARAHRPLPTVRAVALAQLAIEALADGALNEGIAARILARVARTSSPPLAAILRTMAADEARHARDSWDVVAWCLDEGGAIVHRALVKARGDIPDHLGSPLPEAARGGAWLAWGIQSEALERAEYAFVRRATLQRLDRLLALEERAA